MISWLQKLGGFAFAALLILLGAGSILLLARDGFHLFLHDALNWIVSLTDGILSLILETTGIDKIFSALMRALLSAFNIDFVPVLQPHWKQAAALLALAFRSYAAAYKDFKIRPVMHVFRHANALVCGTVGGMMAGTVHLAHPGVLYWPVAAILLFRGFNSIGRLLITSGGTYERGVAAVMAVTQIGLAVVLAVHSFDLDEEAVLNPDSPSPGLQYLAIGVATAAAWVLIFGLRREEKVVADRANTRAENPKRWFDNPARRMGLSMLWPVGLALCIAALDQALLVLAPREDAVVAEAGVGKPFRDCADCPEMTVVPAGRFLMGTTEEQRAQIENEYSDIADFLQPMENEQPAREVDVGSFALQTKEVTLAEFQAFVGATGYVASGMCRSSLGGGDYGFYSPSGNWLGAEIQQGPDHPVICMTWWDAVAYAHWLSLKTGKTYRLPTEAEWEYAARAGSRTPYFWGDKSEGGCAYGHAPMLSAHTWEAYGERGARPPHVGCVDSFSGNTVPAGSYRPNAFGLYDMTGNVSEWVRDCYAESYAGRAQDGSAYEMKSCADRVYRGGGWLGGPMFHRSAERHSAPPSDRNDTRGFRLARTLSPPDR